MAVSLLAMLCAKGAVAAIVSQVLNGHVTEVSGGSGVRIGDPVSAHIEFDDSAELIPGTGLFTATAFTVQLPGGVSLGLADDHRGSPFPVVGFQNGNIVTLDYTALIPVAAYGFAANSLQFNTPFNRAFAVMSGNDTIFKGSLAPVPAALPLLATALGGLALVSHRRRNVA